ncbi:TM2 domain-containing protein [Vibrio zhugei]|uniref:TM2 domain-containing protein n=1 Tax=Vibrio zhugei TaxID=2479546 RepID=A0ABV7C7F3_9VIBR|nr:TM2 domain-containing protein [Vibrio zhugei]
MKGTILDYNDVDRVGIISGDDGQRYNFDIQEWKAATLPKAGTKVDFSAVEQQASAIYVDASASAGLSQAGSKKIAAALFAFFLGAFGAHKFYLGYTKQGVIMLLLFLFGFILLGIPSMIIGIIAFVEFVLYLVKSDEEFEQTYVVGHKPWF